METQRIRRSVAVGTSLTAPLVLWLVVALAGFLVVGSAVAGVVVGLLLAGLLFARSYRRVRRRTLTVGDNGLEVQRDTYRLTLTWSSVTAVQRRRHQGLLLVDELVVADASISWVDVRGRSTAVSPWSADHPSGQRVLVSLYDDRWRDGLIGEQLRRAGVAGV